MERPLSNEEMMEAMIRQEQEDMTPKERVQVKRMSKPVPKPSKSELDETYYQSRNENRVRVYEHLKRKGFSNAAIAGIMANIEVETGGSFDPFQRQTATGDPRRAKMAGTGYGLFQLDKAGKRKDYEEWLEENKKDPSAMSYSDTLEAQLDYMADSIFKKGKYRDRVGPGNADDVKEYIETSNDPAQIALEFSNKWERAGSAHNARRMSKAESILNEINQGQLNRNFMKKLFGSYNEGGMAKQMELFEDGGLLDEGGTTDPVSGNDVPAGSLQKEVRDDIPAQLSEGEFVMPADVVRYHGLDKMMALRDEAKAGLARMEAMGQMGNAEEATIPDGVPFGIEDLELEDEPMQFNVGGVVPGVTTQASQFQATPTGFVGIQQTAPIEQRLASPYAIQQPAATAGQAPLTYAQVLPEVIRETREYVNDQGQIMYVPFINGQVMQGFVIPEGYKPRTDAAQQPAVPQPVQPTAAPAPAPSDDNGAGQPSAPAATTVFGGKSSNGRIVGGTAYEISYDSSGKTLPGVLGALTGGFNRVTLTDPQGRQATMSRDLYNTLKEDRTSSNTVDVLNKLFDYTEAANTQVTQTSGYEPGFFGFGSNRKELESSAAKAIYEDLGLEYKDQPLAEALLVQAEAKQEQVAVPTVRPAAVSAEGPVGPEGVPLTSGAVAPDFVTRPDIAPTPEGPIYPTAETVRPGEVTFTPRMTPFTGPQSEILERRQSPVVPAIMTRPTGEMMTLPQPKPTQAELQDYLYGGPRVEDITGLSTVKTPEMAARLGQDPTAAGVTLSPLERTMLDERVDEPRYPVMETYQHRLLPTMVTRPTGETIPLPTSAADIRGFREQEAQRRQTLKALGMDQQIPTADVPPEPPVADEVAPVITPRGFTTVETEKERMERTGEGMPVNEAIRIGDVARDKVTEARQRDASQYARDVRAGKYDEDFAAMDRAREERNLQRNTGSNKVGTDIRGTYGDDVAKRVRDDQGTVSRVNTETGQISYDSSHDWSKPTQTNANRVTSTKNEETASSRTAKIVCTAMNDAYGFGAFRQTVWLQQSKNLDPAYQKGYHRIFKPLIKVAYSNTKWYNKLLRSTLEGIARRRTADIWLQKKGKRHPIGAVERAILEPICYIVGKIK